MLKAILILSLLVIVSAKSEAIELSLPAKPSRPSIGVPPVIRLPKQLPSHPGMPKGLGGVTVGGGEITQSLCATINKTTLNKSLIADEELASISATRLEAMINISTAYEALLSLQQKGQLGEDGKALFNLLDRRLQEIPDEKIEVMLSACERSELLGSTKLGSKDISYFDQAFDYLNFYSDWEGF